MKRGEWAKQFLVALGNASPDTATINFVASWTLGEGGTARYNPLNTTQEMPDATCYNYTIIGACHVKNYISHEQGLAANVKTIQNGRYPHVLHGLQTNDPEEAVNAIEMGTWGTGLGFTTLWRTGDHRDEELPNHAGATPFGGGGGGGFDQGFIPINPATGKPADPNAPGNEPIVIPSPDAIARNVSFIALGGLLLLVALILAVRTYVPTQQIVKTIAAVA